MPDEEENDNPFEIEMSSARMTNRNTGISRETAANLIMIIEDTKQIIVQWRLAN